LATALKKLSTAFKTQMNATFGNPDKNRLPHVIVLDDGMEFTNVEVFQDNTLN
jgi:hypothetical protein